MTNTTIRLLDDAWAALEAGNSIRARSLARRSVRDRQLALRGEAFHILGKVALETEALDEALSLLGRARSAAYDTADLHYDLGLVHELLGNDPQRRAEFLTVWELDAHLPRIDLMAEDRLVEIAEQTLSELPPRMVELLRNTPIMVEDRPQRFLVEEGLDPRLLGLFEGPPWSDQGLEGPQLTRILLFRANIEAVARTIGAAERQVRITLLHETAHFFGLEEDELVILGLD